MSELERKQQNVLAFYAMSFNHGKLAEAIRRYVGKAYIQPNPTVADSPAAFIEYFEKLAQEWPDKQTHFERVIAEKNLVGREPG